MSDFAVYSNSSTNSTAQTNYTLLFPVPVTAVLGFLSSVVSLATVAGNLLVITSFFVERTLRNATNYFIASLAVTDLLIGVFSMNFYTLYLLLNHWPLGELFCDLWLSLDYTACLTSQYTVFLITVDRFCSVHIPAKYRNWRTDEKVRVMVGVTWIIPSTIFFTCILGWPVFTGDRGRPFDQCWAGFTNYALFNTILTIAYYWVTLVVMCILYAGIYHVALNLQRKSDAKRRKMASLVSMTGQTMSRIGVGLTNETNEDELFKSNQPSNAIELNDFDGDPPNDFKKQKRSKENQKNKSKYVKPDDRSSSPSFPSDSDNVSTNKQNHFQKSTLAPTFQGSQLISQSTKIESPIILDDSPTPSEKSPFSYYCYGITKPVILTSKCSRKTRNKGPGAVSAYSNDSDYQTASGLSTDFVTEFRQILNSDRGITCSNGVIANPDSNPIGMHFIDSNSFTNSRSVIAITLSQRENVFFPSTENNSPIWIRRFDLSDNFDDENNTSDTEIFNERDPTATDTVVISGATKTEVVKASCITFSENSKKTWYRNFSVKSNKRRTTSSFQVNVRVQLSRLVNGICRFCNVLVQRARARTTREPKVIFERGRTENRARKALRTITLILGAFVICWTPYHVLVLVKGYFPHIVNDHLYNMSYWLCYANSPINPFCYALANAQFKKAFLRLLKGDFRRT